MKIEVRVPSETWILRGSKWELLAYSYDTQ